MKFIGDYLKKFDIYGHKISVNYRGNESFNTRMGGLLSLATLVLTFVNTLNLMI